ncbi:MAG: hypothetical protein HC848_01350 [Limnobacter sp.]|nr:hypothetical protein [Limnobacter sp.]
MTIQRVLVLAHGWGYNSQFFQPLMEHWQASAPRWLAGTLVIHWEQGYFQSSQSTELMNSINLQNLAVQHGHLPWHAWGIRWGLRIC